MHVANHEPHRVRGSFTRTRERMRAAETGNALASKYLLASPKGTVRFEMGRLSETMESIALFTELIAASVEIDVGPSKMSYAYASPNAWPPTAPHRSTIESITDVLGDETNRSAFSQGRRAGPQAITQIARSVSWSPNQLSPQGPCHCLFRSPEHSPGVFRHYMQTM